MKDPGQLTSDGVAAVLDRTFTAGVGPGLAVAILRRGDVLASRCYGMANIEHAVPWHADTPAHIASLSKHITAALAIVMSRAGLVDLDANIERYLPELGRFAAPVSLRHLLTNRSGLFHDEALARLAGRTTHSPADHDYLYRLTAAQGRGLHAPGSAYLYNDTGFRLAVRILERAAKADINILARAHLFDPLGMRDTLYVANDEAVIPGLAQCYHRRADGTLKRYFGYMESSGDGGIVSTLNDMTLWARHVSAADLSGALQACDGIYGYGIDMGRHRGLSWWGHTGATFGYCGLHFFGDLAVLFLGNHNGIDIRGLSFDLFDALCAANDADGPSTPYLERRAAPASEDETYVNASAGLVVNIARTGGVIRVGLLGGGAYLREEGGVWVTQEGLMSCRLRFTKSKDTVQIDLGEGWLAFLRADTDVHWSDLASKCVGRYYAPAVGATLDVIDDNGTARADLAGGPAPSLRVALAPVDRAILASSALCLKFDKLRGARYRQLSVSTFGARRVVYRRTN